MQTLFGARLEHHASSAPRSSAFATLHGDVSYAELLGMVRRCAGWLLDEGVAGEGAVPAVVGVTIADDLEHMMVSLALLSLGVPHIGLPSRDPAAGRLELARRLGVRRVVLKEERHALPGIASSLAVPAVMQADAASAAPVPLAADADAPALYYASSGATGRPKVFALTQRALAWRAECIARSERIERASLYRSLMPVSVEDSMAKSRMMSCVWLGAASILVDRAVSPAPSIAQTCTRLGVTCLELTAMQVAGLVAATDGDPLPASTTVYTAGARVPATLRQAFRSRFGKPLWVHYGAREFGRISSTFPDGDGASTETVGQPVPWIDLEVVDADGRPVAAGQVGELKLRASCMTDGYHGDPAGTSRHFRQGWFHPGDLVSLQRDGRLVLHGRADDMMNLDGIKIFPAEIERVLEEHPAIKAAAAFAKPSAAHGEIPIAAVELHVAMSATIDELLAHARARLGVRAPRRIIVVDALPRNSVGKVARRELAQLVASR
ncbi:MAG TPA: AMP-binding protein [Casimicrobiaceae bacterium]|nr:AMP-binding protein [Casimicrobiaceae bacterium]